MRNLLFVSIIMLAGCGSLQENYVKQDRANYETLAPRVRKLMETSDHYDADQEQDIEDRLQGWDAKTTAALAPSRRQRRKTVSKEGAIETHAIIALNEMKETMGEAWAKITPEQQKAATRASRRVVELEWKKRVDGADVDEDLAFVVATVGEFKMAGEIALHDAFWAGVNKALEALGSFLVGAGKSLIPGLGSLVAGIDLGALLNE